MDKAETKRLKRGEAGKIILSLMAVGGIMALAVVAPNAVQLLAGLTGRPRHFYRRGYVETAIDKLVRRKLLRRKRASGGQIYLELTDQGKKELLKYETGKAAIQKPKRWDGKWRVIIFDIKERRRTSRDQLRLELTNLGFVRLQNSVWIYPYECEELIALLKTSFELGRSLLYLTVEKLEGDKRLREAFELKSD